MAIRERVDRVDGVEEFRGASGLVGLQRPDEMELGVWEVGEGERLLLPLLHAVFAEESHPGGVGLKNGLGGVRLGDRHQRDLGLQAVGAAAGLGDLLANAGEVCGQRHARSHLTASRRNRDCIAHASDRFHKFQGGPMRVWSHGPPLFLKLRFVA